MLLKWFIEWRECRRKVKAYAEESNAWNRKVNIYEHWYM